VRIGLRLFGRRRQLRFYRRACARVAALTGAAPGSPPATYRRAAAGAGRARRRR
jgi:hypothetical protein